MIIVPLHDDLIEYLGKHSLTQKFQKQIRLLVKNIKHPSLNTEILEPKKLKIYSFRVDKKYRAIFNYIAPGIIEIIDINNHYR